ncbi:hypothetical protein BU24DRAFT_459826 [Aaosphaeria arxii CBS 175.79]|uniref:Uncharacterized protein n=1 Tax=Aaosphaeria arxii CBS 175.79 TaxID=1450172 RepID=A0A6A5Y4T7_9PLEO|nr:uncharacterized protein BU24DRAFT_459826 [Aaosphaeria arxii CBS 175.79]KAF2020223.1 hypothetical protein BU24DRAFT_459826 [Aaosphaeria arxii CBS 175.79]
MSHETAMNHAGRTSSHPFLDLRSARRAKNRTRKHLLKYSNFDSLTRADLPSSPSQKPHYLPSSCPSHPGRFCLFSTFPAQLSDAPVAKFTKREAFLEAQFAKPPTYQRSSRKTMHKAFPKWERRQQAKKNTTKELLSREWYDDVWGGWGQIETDEDCGWVCPPCPCDDHIEWDAYPGHKVVGGLYDDYGVAGLVGFTGTKPRWEEMDPRWHRIEGGGGWFRSHFPCEEGYCACVAEWDEPRPYTGLDHWHFWSDPAVLDWDRLMWDTSDPETSDEEAFQDGLAEEAWYAMPDDWDVVSEASTEAWSEIAADSEGDLA